MAVILLLLAAACGGSNYPNTQESQRVTMVEQLPANCQLQIRSTVNLTCKMIDSGSDSGSLPSQITASATSSYVEQILQPGQTAAELVARQYTEAALEKNLNGIQHRITLRPEVLLILVYANDGQFTTLCPSGPLTLNELDLLEAEVSTSGLKGLLPVGDVALGESWFCSPAAASELTGVDPIQSGGLRCALQGIQTDQASHSVALVQLSGELTGPSEQGLSRQKLEGHVEFDLADNYVRLIELEAESQTSDATGQVALLSGQMRIERRRLAETDRLVMPAPPTAGPSRASTAILFDHRPLGVQLDYPRNWELAASDQKTIQFKEPSGGKLRINLDPGREVSLEALRHKLSNWLAGQGAKLLSEVPIGDIRQPAGFRMRASLPGQDGAERRDIEFLYILVRQADRLAVLSASVRPDRLGPLQEDIEFIAGHLELTRRR